MRHIAAFGNIRATLMHLWQFTRMRLEYTLEGRIRSRNGKARYLSGNVNRIVLRFSTPRLAHLNFDHAGFGPTCDVISEIHLGEVNVCVGDACAHTCGHWRDPVNRSLRGSPRGSSLSEIFGGLHWFRIVFICRILKLERPLFVDAHTRARTHTMRSVECQGKSKIGKTNHACRSPSRVPPYFQTGVLCLSIRRGVCEVYAKTIAKFRGA